MVIEKQACFNQEKSTKNAGYFTEIGRKEER